MDDYFFNMVIGMNYIDTGGGEGDGRAGRIILTDHELSGHIENLNFLRTVHIDVMTIDGNSDIIGDNIAYGCVDRFDSQFIRSTGCNGEVSFVAGKVLIIACHESDRSVGQATEHTHGSLIVGGKIFVEKACVVEIHALEFVAGQHWSVATYVELVSGGGC